MNFRDIVFSAGFTEYVTVQTGEEVTLQCPTTSTEYSWEHKRRHEFTGYTLIYKQGKYYVARNPPKFNESFFANASYLTVFDVRGFDSGTYKCSAVSGGGSALYIQLVVFGETFTNTSVFYTKPRLHCCLFSGLRSC